MNDNVSIELEGLAEGSESCDEGQYGGYEWADLDGILVEGLRNRRLYRSKRTR